MTAAHVDIKSHLMKAREAINIPGNASVAEQAQAALIAIDHLIDAVDGLDDRAYPNG